MSDSVTNHTARPLRVGIDGRVLMHYELRGFTRTTIELFRAMQDIAGSDLELISFSPGPLAPEFLKQLRIASVVFSARREILWEQVELPRQLVKAGIDVFHATANRGLPYRRVCKYVLTCHDVIDRLPEFCKGEHWRGTWRKKYSDFASRHSADKYLTDSEFSKRDICRFHGVAAERVAIVHLAADDSFHRKCPVEHISKVQIKYGLPRNYFLFLAGFDYRKNVSALLDAYAHLPSEVPSLVLAGEHKWEFAAVRDKIAVLGLTARVVCPEKIAQDDIPAIYQGAIALVHPSLYEGFGLQLAEAMACGTPVIASNVTSMPEVLDGCGLLVDPRDPASIAQQMIRVVRDDALRATMVEKGRQRARDFSWRKSAGQVLAIYRDLLGHAAVPQAHAEHVLEERR